MLILSPVRVASALRAGTLGEDDKVRLVLAWAALQVVFGARSVLEARSWTEVVLMLLYVVAAMAGIVRCYRTNQAGDGRAFIERFVCLGVPSSIWIFGGNLLLSSVLAAMLRAKYGNRPPAPALFTYLIVLPFGSLVIYFAVLQRLLQRVASTPAP